MSDDVVLQAMGLGRRFPGAEGEIEVLRDASLSVRRGEVVGIVGASGVGKSTLLHILGSLDRPDEGTVTVEGEDVHSMTGARLDRLRNQVLGFVFQFHFLLPEFTAVENIMMPLLVAGTPHGEAAGRASRWLEKVGLSDRALHRPSELSGGEQQRVAVARALVNAPAVVLADEPTGNLDDATGEEIHGLIRALADEEGKTFVVVTHKRSFALHADRVLLLAAGRLTPLES
jgi:lipoprotein-releasing system ATP-binding protein